MNILLDTHCFIWFVNGDKTLSSNSRRLIESSSNNCYISIASLWEMAIKISLEKLIIKRPFENIINIIEENGFEILPITYDHTARVSKLSFHHRDPFDRMIIAQALTEKMAIVSHDSAFDLYRVKRIW